MNISAQLFNNQLSPEIENTFQQQMDMADYYKGQSVFNRIQQESMGLEPEPEPKPEVVEEVKESLTTDPVPPPGPTKPTKKKLLWITLFVILALLLLFFLFNLNK